MYFFYFSLSIVEEYLNANISAEEYSDLMDSLCEILDKEVTSQALPQPNANVDTLDTPIKEPDEPIASPVPTYEYPAPPTRTPHQSSQVQLNAMQAVHTSTVEQSPQTRTPLNLSGEYTQFFDLNNMYYTPIKTSSTSTNYMIPLMNFTTIGGTVGMAASNTPVYASVLVNIPTGVTTTSAIPATLMTSQIQVDPVLNKDELNTLNRQLDGGPVDKKNKPAGYRCRRRRFGAAEFSELENVEEVTQVLIRSQFPFFFLSLTE